MTANKDFKRIVRAKARRTGQSYSAVLQRLRTDGREPSKERIPMTIVRTVPDIRALDLSVSRAFYVDLLGFKIAMDQAGMLMFASPTEPKQQVTLNGDAENPRLYLRDLPWTSAFPKASPIFTPGP